MVKLVEKKEEKIPPNYQLDVRFRSPLVPDVEIPVGFAAAIKYPKDYHDQSLADRTKEVYYDRIENQPFGELRGWTMCVADRDGYLRDIHGQELEKCEFYYWYPVLKDGGKIELQGGSGIGYSRKREMVLTDLRRNAPEEAE